MNYKRNLLIFFVGEVIVYGVYMVVDGSLFVVIDDVNVFDG